MTFDNTVRWAWVTGRVFSLSKNSISRISLVTRLTWNALEMWIKKKSILVIVDISQLNGSVKELNKFYIYETEKITRKANDVAEYIELFGSFTRNRHARRI